MFIKPSIPIPPRMSDVESGVPNAGVSADFLYGTGVPPTTGEPTSVVALPPECGYTITS
jgi:hypothetical protein